MQTKARCRLAVAPGHRRRQFADYHHDHERAIATFSRNAYKFSSSCLLLLCSISVALIATGAAGAEDESQLIISACKNELDFDSLGEFDSFIAQFKAKSERELGALEDVPASCVKQRQAILELESLVVRESVCDSVQIDALINYHNKHFKSKRGGLSSVSLDWNPFRKRKSDSRHHSGAITHKFFSKYAIQVAHTCKRNLVANLETSRELLYGAAKSLEEAKERVFSERPSLRMNIKLIEEQPDAPATTNVKPKSESELTLGEYREALTRLRRPEDVLTFERGECETSSNRYVEVAADKIQMFFKPALVCLKLAQYYSGSVLSIARLANYGYVAKDDELDLKLADSQLVKDWIVAAQVCEPMLYMRVADKTDERTPKPAAASRGDEGAENAPAIVDTCSERVLAFETMVFEDKLDDLAERDKLEEWLQRSEATRHQAQQIMKSAMRKLAKVSLMRELSRAGKIKKRHMFSLGTLKSIMGAASMGVQAGSVSSRQTLARNMMARSGVIDVSSLDGKHSDAKSFETLVQIMSAEGANAQPMQRQSNDNSGADDIGPDGDGRVAFEPLTSLASTVTIIAIMLTFEWLFFVVMTLAARICQRLNFNFDNLLTFPPKVLSWSDADFVQYTENLDKIDEDDFFDYDELNPEEQKQRDLLAKVFGKAPPLLFKE